MKLPAYILSTLLVAGSPLAAQEITKVSTKQLIEQLGDPDYATRKAAEKQLQSRGAAALEALKKSAESHTDPEVQWRAGRLVRRIQEGEKAEDSGRRKLGRREGGKARPEQEIERESGAKDRRRVLEDALKNLDRTFDGREFGGDLQRQIDRAMEQMRQSLKEMDKGLQGGLKGLDAFGPGDAMRRSSSQSMKMTQGPDGIRVEITEKGADGKPKTKVYEAEDMESFQKKHPGVLKDRGIKIDVGEMFGESFPFRGRILRPRVLRDADSEGRRVLRKKGDDRERGEAAEVVEDDRKRLGFYIGKISPAVREYLELEGGLMVASVADGSLAEKIGLRAVDIVVRVGAKKIFEVDDVADALEAIGDSKVVVKAIRKGKEITLR